MYRNPAHDVLFEPVQIGQRQCATASTRPRTAPASEPVPGAQAHFRGDESRGRMGSGQHRVLLRSTLERRAPWSPRGSGTRTTCATSGSDGDLAHEHDSLAGVELGYGGCRGRQPGAPAPARSVGQMPDETLYIDELLRDWIEAEDPRGPAAATSAAPIVPRTRASTSSTSRRRVRDRSPALPDAKLQPAHRRVRRLNREPRALLARDPGEVREAIGDQCAITARLCVDTLNGSADSASARGGGVGFIELADDLVDFWDLQAGGGSRGVDRRGRRAPRASRGVLPTRVHRAARGRDEEAGRRGRALHQPGHDGRGDPRRA